MALLANQDPFLLGRVAPRMIFWTGDAFDQPALQNFGHESLQANVDLTFCVSNWQRETFIGAFGLRISRTTSDFYVASRTVSPLWNASAIGGPTSRPRK